MTKERYDELREMNMVCIDDIEYCTDICPYSFINDDYIKLAKNTYKYRWHKISKDGLPDEGDEVLVTDGKYYGISELISGEIDQAGTMCYWFDSWEDAIAWKYIEPYERSDNE